MAETVRVSFDIKHPGGCTEDEVVEWLRFALFDAGAILSSNPLIDKSVEPIYPTLDIQFRGGGGR